MNDLDRTFEALLRPVLEVSFVRKWHDSVIHLYEFHYTEPVTNNRRSIIVKKMRELESLEKTYNVRIKVVNV